MKLSLGKNHSHEFMHIVISNVKICQTMDTRTFSIVIVLALIVGAGAGYTLSPDSTSSPELESQIEEYQGSIRTLENEKTDLRTTLTSAISSNTELQTSLTSAVNENTELQNILADARNLFESVESQLSVIQAGFGPPDYDSGWVPIDAGDAMFLKHGLGTVEDLFVYVIGRSSPGEFNHWHYGFSYSVGGEAGLAWGIDSTSVDIIRGFKDVYWEEVRVYIWRIPQGPAGPAIPSGGSTIPSGGSLIPDTKYVPIHLIGQNTMDDTGGSKMIIVDLEGYKEVYITWWNWMVLGGITFEWVIEDPTALGWQEVDGVKYSSVKELLKVEQRGEVNSNEGQLYRVQGKYLRITVTNFANVPDREFDNVKIILYATK